MHPINTIAVEELINADEQEIFEYLTKDILLEKWFATSAKTFPHINGKYWLSFQYNDHRTAGFRNHTEKGEYKMIIPFQTIIFDWMQRTLVNITLSKTEFGTKIELIHSGWILPEDSAIKEHYILFWQEALANLKSVIENQLDQRPNHHIKTKEHPQVFKSKA